MTVSWRTSRPGPLIVAHRGSSARAPENTLASFELAIDEGAHAIELDVRLSKDGELIVCHDASIDRCSDGSGDVANLTLRELKRFSAGTWFGKRFAGERIPTLREVVERFGHRIAINIELKAGRFEKRSILPDRCCELVASFHLRESVLITSFQHSFIRRVRRIHPGIPAGLLLNPAHLIRRSVRMFPGLYDFDYVVIGGASLRKSFVAEAHRHGVKVGEFTVNSRRRLERACRFGVDAVITNDPLIIRHAG